MYERKSQRLLSRKLFYQRVLKNILLALFIFFLCMIIGVAGFCLTAKASWIDAFHNSAMLLSGMGPVLQNYPTVAVFFILCIIWRHCIHYKYWGYTCTHNASNFSSPAFGRRCNLLKLFSSLLSECC